MKGFSVGRGGWGWVTRVVEGGPAVVVGGVDVHAPACTREPESRRRKNKVGDARPCPRDPGSRPRGSRLVDEALAHVDVHAAEFESRRRKPASATSCPYTCRSRHESAAATSMPLHTRAPARTNTETTHTASKPVGDVHAPTHPQGAHTASTRLLCGWLPHRKHPPRKDADTLPPAPLGEARPSSPGW